MTKQTRTSNPVYRAWQTMKSRCLTKTDKSYSYYGGRGIKIYEEWINDFDKFYAYVGVRPSPKHSLDRFPNCNGNYEPGNVRWATSYQQMSNLRKNVHLTANGITKHLAEWARILNVKHEAIRYHLKKGRTMEQILLHYKIKSDKRLTSLRWSFG